MPEGFDLPDEYIDNFGFRRVRCECRCIAQVDCDLERARHLAWADNMRAVTCADDRAARAHWNRRIKELEDERGRLLAGRTGAAIGDLITGRLARK